MTRKGTVYLICFHRPYAHARHYLGWTTDLAGRLQAHATGQGARLMAVLREAGIGWTLVRVWLDVERSLERQMKNHNARYCPRCSPRRVRWELAGKPPRKGRFE